MTQYYIFTPDGPVEISKQEYINIRIDELMNIPVDYKPFMSYVDIGTTPQRRLPKGV